MGRIPSPAQLVSRPGWTARNVRIIGLLVLVILIAGTGHVSGNSAVGSAGVGTTVPIPQGPDTVTTPLPPPPGPPILSLGPPQTAGNTVTIGGSVQPGDRGVTITQVSWDWGDGIRVIQNTPPWTHTYREGGTYLVQVEARQSDGQSRSSSLWVNIPITTTPTTIPTRIPTPRPNIPLGAVIANSAGAHDGMAVVSYDSASDAYGYYTVYRYPDGRGWYRHQSESDRRSESRRQLEGWSMVTVAYVDASASLPIEARHVYLPFRYGIGDIVGETASGQFQVVTRVEEGNPSYYSPGGYAHKLVWKDDQGRWRTYAEGSGETFDTQANFESRYPALQAHVELGTVIGGEPSPQSSSSGPTQPPTTTTTTTTVPTPPPVSSPLAIPPTPIVIVVDRMGDIDAGMTPYSGLTAPPTTSEPQTAATAPGSAPPPVIMGTEIATATTTAGAQPLTYASAVATTAAQGDGGSMVLYILGALIVVFGLVVGGIAYRSRISAGDAPVPFMGPRQTLSPAPTPILIGPASPTLPVEQVPWEGYSPLGSDSYDLLARLRRYEDGMQRTGLGGSTPLDERLDLSLIPTLPIPAAVRELGPEVGCRVLSVDHRGDAVCLRDQNTPEERFDVVPVEEILKLIETRYEQRWVPREP